MVVQELKGRQNLSQVLLGLLKDLQPQALPIVTLKFELQPSLHVHIQPGIKHPEYSPLFHTIKILALRLHTQFVSRIQITHYCSIHYCADIGLRTCQAVLNRTMHKIASEKMRKQACTQQRCHPEGCLSFALSACW